MKKTLTNNPLRQKAYFFISPTLRSDMESETMQSTVLLEEIRSHQLKLEIGFVLD